LDLAAVLAKLEAMRDALVNRKALVCNVTLDAANWNTLKPKLDGFLSRLPAKNVQRSTFNVQRSIQKEGLTVPAQVNYVGKGANLYELGYQYDGSVEVILGFMRLTYLWDKIRIQGGAYGAFCTFDDRTGVFTYLSYRDPNLAATIENYDKAAAFLKGLDSMHRFHVCPGYLNGGGREHCEMRACALEKSLNACSACQEENRCKQAEALHHMREGAVAAGPFVSSGIVDKQKFITELVE
jgi:hypothetical protein